MSDEGIDASILRRLHRLGRGTVERLVAIFVRTAPEMLQDLAEAVAAGNADRLVSASHRLRGMSANMGARRLSECCEQLKTAALEGTVPSDAAEQVVAIAGEYKEAAAALMAWSSRFS